MKVCFDTFGCRLNRAEALQMEAEYLAKGWQITEKHSDADLIVIRGCSVTSRAQRDCERLIAHLRHHYPSTPLQICGCLKSDSSTDNSAVIRARELRLHHLTASNGAESVSSSALPTRTARAYLKVQDGCSGRCSFCIVPSFRGSSKSETFTDVIDKARQFIDSGYHEIVVTGCNLSLYASEGKRLPELVASLAELSSDCRIRLGSLEPGACADETVPAMAEHNNICRYLHIPIQSGSNTILRSMNRPYTLSDIENLVSEATKLMPKLGLGCDVMTGFPGETSVDFAATKSLLQRLPFTNAHVFPYSARPGTTAVALPMPIPKETRSARAHELSSVMKVLRQRFAKSFIGKTVEIIVEKEDKCTGWTGEYLTCEAIGTSPRKSVARILVLKATGDKLAGRLLQE